MGYSGFKYSPEYYTPEGVKAGKISARDYRTEYQRLYRVVQKRLRRFESAGRTDAAAYRYNVDRIKPSTELTDAQLGRALNDVYRMLTSVRGSVNDLRKWEREQVERFHELGMDFITVKNLRQFGEFMEEARAQNMDRIYGSESVQRVYKEAVRKGIDPEQVKDNFAYWLERREELEALPRHKSPEARTAAAYRAELEKGKKKKKKSGKR